MGGVFKVIIRLIVLIVLVKMLFYKFPELANFGKMAIPTELTATKNNGFDLQAKATLQRMRIAFAAYKSVNGHYPVANKDDLKGLKEKFEGAFPSKVKIRGSKPGTLTGYRGNETKYVLTAIGADKSRVYKLNSVGGGISGP